MCSRMRIERTARPTHEVARRGRRCALGLAAVLVASVCGAAPAERLRALAPPELRPALALVVDTSQASLAVATLPPPYDPSFDYATLLDARERCDTSRVYWRRGPGPAPDCLTAGHVPLIAIDAATGLHCERARAPLASDGVFVAARLAQWLGTAQGGLWRAPGPDRDAALECREDRGLHGATAGRLYASDGRNAWSTDARSEIDWDQPPLGDVYLLYTGHYLDYLRARGRLPKVAMTRADARDAGLAAALRATPSLEVALLRLSHDGGSGDAAGDGGTVVRAFGADERAPGAAALAALLAPAGGPAPLAEATVEALRVAAGLTVGTGLDAYAAPGAPRPSVPESRDALDAARYLDPYAHACRALSIALLAQDAPSADDSAATHAAALPGLADLRCDDGCLAALAARLPSLDLRADLPDAQRPALFFAAAGAPSRELIAATRAAGATPLDVLAAGDGFVQVLAGALQHDAATLPAVRITPPALLVGSDAAAAAAIFGLERPAARLRPLGNLRRYGLATPTAGGGPAFTDRAGDVGIDAEGALVPGTTSLWSDAADGDDPLAGGAAARLAAPALRRVFTDVDGDALAAATNRVQPGNPRIDAASLGLPADAGVAARDRLIDWLRGADVDDLDGDGDAAEATGRLGAPRADAPLLLRYDPDRERVLIVGRDGRVQFFDAATGDESWSYLPAAVLKRTALFAANEATALPEDALGAPPRLHRLDANGDGRIQPADGDHLWLFLGYRAPPRWLALDLTNPEAPRRLWQRDAAALTGAGSAASDEAPPPALGRLRIASAAQDAGAVVLLIASGHDALLDGPIAQADRTPPGLALVDAASGVLLWRAARDAGAGVDLAVAGLVNGFAAPPRLVDLDGDGFIDRGYAVDVVGRIWRLDFTNGTAPAALVRLRLFATLGASSGEAALARLRFQQEPDVALARDAGGRPHLTVALGSGHAARPRVTDVVDRLYVLRDPGARPGDAVPPVVDDTALVDVTDAVTAVPASARGWRLTLDAHGAGEQAAAPAVTLDHRVLFTTWQPRAPDRGASCHPPMGVTRAWTLSLASGAAARVVDATEDPDADPRGVELAAPGWPARTRVQLVPDARCAADCPPLALGVLGTDVLPLDLDTRARRTVWRDRGVDAASR
jgi:type IV pilus assembly protein PilY1